MRRSGAARLWPWLVLLALFVAIEVPLDLAGLPSPALFGALLAGLVCALTLPRPVQLPAAGVTLAQAVLGSAIGVLISVDTLEALGADWLPVLLVSLGTLGLSVLAGYVLRLHPGVSPATSVFSMIAGGASGIVAIARDLGADDRIVAVVQYLRVLVIIFGMPVVTQLIFDAVSGTAESSGAATVDGQGWATTPLAGVLFAAVCVTAGLVLRRWIRIPAGSLLLPLLVAVLISVSGVLDGVQVPALVQSAAFAVIGAQVGLRFTRESLRSVATLLPLALVAIAGLIVATALLGVALAKATGHSALDGYLATTPGGLYAVLATAIGSGSDVTFVLTVQVVRLLVMLFSAPVLARWLARPDPGPDSGSGAREGVR